MVDPTARSTASSSHGAPPWYVLPAPVTLVATTVAAVLWILTPAARYEQLTHSLKVTSDVGVLYFWLCGAGFALGALISNGALGRGRRVTPPTDRIASTRLLRDASIAGFVLVLVGYAVWLGLAASRAGGLGSLSSIMIGVIGSTPLYEIKAKYFATLPGVTTLGQLAIVVAPMLTIWRTRLSSGQRPIATAMIAVIFGCAMIRAVLLSERLALIECALPVFVVTAMSRRAGFRRFQFVVPIAGVSLLYLLFTLAEYFRSWVFYSGKGYDSLWVFTLYRLGSYYTTSVNNAAYLVQHGLGLATPGYNSLTWVWTFPVFGPNLLNYSALTGLRPDDALGNALFGGTLNPEFNQFSTPGYLFLDFGWFGIVYAMVLGAVIQQLYNNAERGDWVWLTVYAAMFTGLLEFPRIYYLPLGRLFAALFFVLAVALVRWLRDPAAWRPARLAGS